MHQPYARYTGIYAAAHRRIVREDPHKLQWHGRWAWLGSKRRVHPGGKSSHVLGDGHAPSRGCKLIKFQLGPECPMNRKYHISSTGVPGNTGKTTGNDNVLCPCHAPSGHEGTARRGSPDQKNCTCIKNIGPLIIQHRTSKHFAQKKKISFARRIYSNSNHVPFTLQGSGSAIPQMVCSWKLI